jgi:beta-glucosidase
VQQSLVLLDNPRGLVPLPHSARVLVAGKNAHDRGHQCGGFTVAWQGQSGNDHIEGGTSIWEGIRALAPHAELSVDGSAADPARHDVAIVVIGERPYAEGMGDIRPATTVARGSGPAGKASQLAPYGASLVLSELHPEDLRTIRSIAERGVPVVTVLVSGRPLVVDAEHAHSAAFVAAWLPGSEGQGVADVLFGDAPFTGTLPMTWPGGTARWARGHRA